MWGCFDRAENGHYSHLNIKTVIPYFAMQLTATYDVTVNDIYSLLLDAISFHPKLN